MLTRALSVHCLRILLNLPFRSKGGATHLDEQTQRCREEIGTNLRNQTPPTGLRNQPPPPDIRSQAQQRRPLSEDRDGWEQRMREAEAEAAAVFKARSSAVGPPPPPKIDRLPPAAKAAGQHVVQLSSDDDDDVAVVMKPTSNSIPNRRSPPPPPRLSSQVSSKWNNEVTFSRSKEPGRSSSELWSREQSWDDAVANPGREMMSTSKDPSRMFPSTPTSASGNDRRRYSSSDEEEEDSYSRRSKNFSSRDFDRRF